MGRQFSRSGGWSEFESGSYRSGLEEKNAIMFEKAGVNVEYEEAFLEYEVPSSKHRYTPDFILPNGVIVETKGLLSLEDRKKHIIIKKQFPHLDIRFVFSNPNQKLYKGSPTTYTMWCKKQGFLYAQKLTPVQWLRETTKDTTGLKRKGTKEPK